LSKGQKTSPPLERKGEQKPDPILTEKRINDLIKRVAERIRQREKRQLIQEGLSDFKPQIEESSKDPLSSLAGDFAQCFIMSDGTPAQYRLFSLWPSKLFQNDTKLSVQWFHSNNKEPFLDAPGIYIMTPEEGDKKFFERCKKQAFFTNFLRIKVFNLLQKTLHIDCLNKLRTEVTAQISGDRPSEPFIEILAELPQEFHQEALKHGKEKGLLSKDAS
jgi:hypothetical protein